MLLTDLNTNAALEVSRRDRKPFVFFDEREVEELKTGAKKVSDLPYIGPMVPTGWHLEHVVFDTAVLREALASLESDGILGFGLVDPPEAERVPLVGVYRKV